MEKIISALIKQKYKIMYRTGNGPAIALSSAISLKLGKTSVTESRFKYTG